MKPFIYFCTVLFFNGFFGCGKSEHILRIRNESSDTLINAMVGSENYGSVPPHSFTDYKYKFEERSYPVAGNFKSSGTLISLTPNEFTFTGKGTIYWCMAITADRKWTIAAEDRKDPNQ